MTSLVIAELARIQSGKTGGTARNLVILAVSVILFISLGLFSNSVSGILLLVGVIFVHELGHLVGMKIFKYKDVHMFFIPLFGAAVSGKEVAPSGLTKAIVSLLGPVPGIFIGILTGFAYHVTEQPFLVDASRTFLFLNIFNLLPIHPLDGGQFLDAVLFSRHPRVELVFKIVTTLVLIWLAVVLSSVFFGVFAFLVLISLRAMHMSSSIAYAVRGELDPGEDLSPQEVPDRHVGKIVGHLRMKLPSEQWKAHLLAGFVSGIWQRVRNRPCSGGATAGLMVCYVFFILLGLVSTFAFEIARAAVMEKNSATIEQPAGPNSP